MNGLDEETIETGIDLCLAEEINRFGSIDRDRALRVIELGVYWTSTPLEYEDNLKCARELFASKTKNL